MQHLPIRIPNFREVLHSPFTYTTYLPLAVFRLPLSTRHGLSQGYDAAGPALLMEFDLINAN